MVKKSRITLEVPVTGDTFEATHAEPSPHLTYRRQLLHAEVIVRNSRTFLELAPSGKTRPTLWVECTQDSPKVLQEIQRGDKEIVVVYDKRTARSYLLLEKTAILCHPTINAAERYYLS